MNRLVIVLIMILLPLRGWAGDVMGVQSATSRLAAHATGAMPADCPMHATAAADPSSQAPTGGDCCTSCDLCIPMASLTSPLLDVIAFTAHAAPPMHDVDFVSASSALTLRPPIS